MADAIVTRSEQAAAVAAVTADIDRLVPSFVRDRVTPDLIAFVTFNALMAAAKDPHEPLAAASASVSADLDKLVPGFIRGRITPDVIKSVAGDALTAAAKARAAHMAAVPKASPLNAPKTLDVAGLVGPGGSQAPPGAKT